MYLKNMNDNVKELVEKINMFDKENKLKFIDYIFNLWDRNQINSLNDVNPDLLDDIINIEIFNPSSIGYSYLVKENKEYWNYTYQLYCLYPKEYKELIPVFEKISFKEKKDVLAELILILEHNKLLPNSIDGYEIARRIIKYY